MKRRKLKMWVKVMLVVILIGGLIILYNNAKQNRIKEERAMVETYVTCLNENWTQRDYCAKKQGANYIILDQQLEKYGYTYKQVGYDLFVVEK